MQFQLGYVLNYRIKLLCCTKKNQVRTRGRCILVRFQDHDYRKVLV